MPTYFVDDGGDNSDGSTWAKAYTNLRNLVAGVANALTTSGNIIYIGADTEDTIGGTANHSANYTITGPNDAAPVYLISSTVGSGTTVSYSAATGNQIDTSSGAYSVSIDNAVVLIGIRIKSGAGITLNNGAIEILTANDMYLLPGANGTITIGSAGGANARFKNLTVNCTADGTTARSANIISATSIGVGIEINGLSILNGEYRTGAVFSTTTSCLVLVSGADVSSCTNATECELLNITNNGPVVRMSNVLTKASFVPAAPTGERQALHAMMTNVGPADAPTYLYLATAFGAVTSSSSIYRTGGATVEGDACSWLITTTANCAEGAPFYTPWIYGTVSSAGSKTFDLYITNDTADFDNSMVWLEVESLSTADEALWALASDQRDNGTGAFISITEAVDTQTDDTTSTWNGTGPSFTYKQKLSVSATVGETGQYRARVAVGVASIAGSRYFYVDPKVTVT